MQSQGNMSKKTTADNEPSNALIMRTLTAMNSKFDRLPTLEHLKRLEDDLHSKASALKQELRSEFKADMQQQAERMNEMIAEVKNQVGAAAVTSGRNDVQQGRYGI